MKKYVKVAFGAVVAAVAGYNVYQSQSVINGMSEFALANVEELASGEAIVNLPCVMQKDEYCTYIVKLVSGQTQKRTEFDLKNYR